MGWLIGIAAFAVGFALGHGCASGWRPRGTGRAPVGGYRPLPPTGGSVMARKPPQGGSGAAPPRGSRAVWVEYRAV